MMRTRHHRSWGRVRRHLRTASGQWLIAADWVVLHRMNGGTVSRYA